MDWVRELCDLYEKNANLAGQYEKGRFGEPLILLPVFHSTVASQITVTIDEKGEFLRAVTVEDEEKLTVIPVTEKSASRTAGVEAHPLCDNLKYLAGDYMDYVVPDKGKGYTENHKLYMEGLRKWVESAFSHEKVQAIWNYLNQECLMKDLVSYGCLKTDGQGKVLKTVKIQNVSQIDSFVRFRVEKPWDIEGNLLEGLDGAERPECWLDVSLENAYIAYCRASWQKRGLSYLTGNQEHISYLHPKKIRNEGDGAKLISANDETYFTYRGRFSNKDEAFAIGYEDSQKAHNALKWIIRRQGRNWNSLCVVTWESDLIPLPDWCLDTDMVCDIYESEDVWGDEEESGEGPGYAGTNPRDAARFQAAIAGYRARLDVDSRTVLMAFDAATTGRLAIMEYESLASSHYLERLREWYTGCGWLHPKFKDKKYCLYYGMAGVRDIADILYGSEQNGMLTLKGGNEKMYAEVLKRLLPCIISGRPVPEDMVHLAYRKASSPVSYDSWYNWERVLALACSFEKKKRMEQRKEEWTVALNTESQDRNYLYGRLLAIADRVEYRTFEKDEVRETNAKRFMNAFSQQPFRTWKVIEERLGPYFVKLSLPERLRYEHMIEDVSWKFQEGDFEKNDALNGLYLLGYHNQSYAFRNYAEEEKK